MPVGASAIAGPETVEALAAKHLQGIIQATQGSVLHTLKSLKQVRLGKCAEGSCAP